MKVGKLTIDVEFTFNNDTGSPLKKAYVQDADSDVVHLASTANVVRSEIFEIKSI